MATDITPKLEDLLSPHHKLRSATGDVISTSLRDFLHGVETSIPYATAHSYCSTLIPTALRHSRGSAHLSRQGTQRQHPILFNALEHVLGALSSSEEVQDIVREYGGEDLLEDYQLALSEKTQDIKALSKWNNAYRSLLEIDGKVGDVFDKIQECEPITDAIEILADEADIDDLSKPKFLNRVGELFASALYEKGVELQHGDTLDEVSVAEHFIETELEGIRQSIAGYLSKLHLSGIDPDHVGHEREFSDIVYSLSSEYAIPAFVSALLVDEEIRRRERTPDKSLGRD